MIEDTVVFNFKIPLRFWKTNARFVGRECFEKKTLKSKAACHYPQLSVPGFFVSTPDYHVFRIDLCRLCGYAVVALKNMTVFTH